MNTDETNDDTQGHGFRGPRGDAPQPDDTEGHRFKFVGDAGQAEDTEGHMPRISGGRVEDAGEADEIDEADDTEGHAIKGH